MHIVISSGHGKHIRGAAGSPVPPQLDEVDEARKVVKQVVEYLREMGVTVTEFHDDVSTNQSDNLNWIVNHHNGVGPHDLDVSVHFNAYDGSAHGTECLYVTQENLARDVSAAIAEAGKFTNRGPKYRSDLKFLNSTNEPSILIETAFCDNTGDSNLYRQYFQAICQAIAETISGRELSDQPVEPPPVERPPPEYPSSDWPIYGTVSGLSPNDRLNIRAEPSASAVKIGDCGNGSEVKAVGESPDRHWYKLEFGLGVLVYGWASQDYITLQTDPTESEQWHHDITATVFGHEGDEQEGSYGGWIDSDTVGVSFPYKWRDGPRPQVVVRGPRGEMTVDVVDVGPWNTDDPDYVLGMDRPLAEMQYEDGTRAQNGQVPTNDAGIDLTKPVADAVGVSGKGKVSWRFV